MQTSGEVQSEEVDKCMHQSNSKNILFKGRQGSCHVLIMLKSTLVFGY